MLLNLGELVFAVLTYDVIAVSVFRIYRMLLPICDRLVLHQYGRAVVHGLGHGRSRSVYVFTKAQGSLKGKVGYEERHLETELYTHMPLVNSSHGEIGERVV